MNAQELAELDLAVSTAIGVDVFECTCSENKYKRSDTDRHFAPSRDIAEAMRLAAERGFAVEFVNAGERAEVGYIHNTGHLDWLREPYADHSGDRIQAACVAICRAVIAAKAAP